MSTTKTIPKKRKTDHLITESVNPRTVDIDLSSTRKIFNLISNEDKSIAKSVYEERQHIIDAIELIHEKLKLGGRLFIAGAGTSGRLGVLEAAECPPTFGTSPKLVTAIIAGGKKAVWKSLEGAEDSFTDAKKQLQKEKIMKNDIIIGITASGDTPFVTGALKFAKSIRVSTILLTFNTVSNGKADIVISPVLGPEVISGSTRMKAGTATKMILNMITTSVMIKSGKTYQNLMIDVQPRSEKLRNRACKIVRELAKTTNKRAYSLLAESGWDVKVAVLMGIKNISSPDARCLLKENEGFLRRALK